MISENGVWFSYSGIYCELRLNGKNLNGQQSTAAAGAGPCDRGFPAPLLHKRLKNVASTTMRQYVIRIRKQENLRSLKG